MKNKLCVSFFQNEMKTDGKYDKFNNVRQNATNLKMPFFGTRIRSGFVLVYFTNPNSNLTIPPQCSDAWPNFVLYICIANRFS